MSEIKRVLGLLSTGEAVSYQKRLPLYVWRCASDSGVGVGVDGHSEEAKASHKEGALLLWHKEGNKDKRGSKLTQDQQ